MIEGHKVVAPHEMARIERLAYAEGASEIQFMENAGIGIAKVVQDYVKAHHLKKQVTLLVGKGNNGGDALTAGRHLRAQGFLVKAFHLFSLGSCSPLCQKQAELFKLADGDIEVLHNVEELKFLDGIILDGIFGTGFKGSVEGLTADVIKAANSSGCKIIAVDIPSGVNGDSGAVESVAIQAEQTLSLGLPKLGFFIGEGWNHLGELAHIDFGLGSKYTDQAAPKAFLLDDKKLSYLFAPVKRNRHKYQKGYVLAVAGSEGLSGAAILSSFAALRSGAGMVRLFYPEEIEYELSRAPVELIKESWDYQNFARIFKESKRAHAMLIGPGLGRSRKAEKMLKKLLANLLVPCVIDADALFILSEHSSWNLPQHCILTPHREEMERLLELGPKNLIDDVSLHTLCQKYVERKKVTLVLKGGPSFIFHPHSAPLLITHGTPGLATAGTGDVLTGVITAFLAQRLDPRIAAVLGVSMHGIAGEIASKQKTLYCMVASDVIENLPEAFKSQIPSL